MVKVIFRAAVEEIRKGKRFIVVSHVSPEGDAVGSLLGLSLALKGIGKEVIPYLEDKLPDIYRFLPGSELLCRTLSGAGEVDATFAVDCGQLERLGKGFASFKGRGKIVNMDHHVTNDNFGDINIVVPEASAAGEIVFDLLVSAGIKITKDVATNLYVAIHTDTGSFRYSSSTPEAFRKAGELVRCGADPWDTAMKVYENYPAEKFKLLGAVLSTLELANGGKVAVVRVTLDMLKSVGGDKDLTDGFVNYARAIEGVEVGVLFRECAAGEYKVSLRSKGEVDVSSVAERFGGGGHSHAAGFNIKGGFEEVRTSVSEALLGPIGGAKKARAGGPS
ncbi:MAG: bifunctional oligoribonuclease/PAP phosphatase NrnA [Deltaproteobacteria bacterium]|nr:bifunctional oligoribonuclease/PAP phosphatase NrnA [Deltaproteobacteria bacterium]